MRRLWYCTDGGGDDNPTLSIVGISDGYEGGPAAVFEVQLDQANSTGAPITGTVTLGGTGSGYATGADITATSTSTQYEIPVNERTTSISVGINNDDENEGTETLTAVLDGTPAGVNRGTDTASVFIIDNDAGTTPSETVAVTVSITAISPTITEGETASFSVYLEGGATATTTITGTVSFSPEAEVTPTVSLLYRIGPDASSVTVSVATNDNGISDGTRTLIATLDSTNEGALGITTAEVEILDNDPTLPTVRVSIMVAEDTKAQDYIEEGGTTDTANFTVYLEDGPATRTISGLVHFTAPGVPDDVTPTVTSYSISPGTTSTLVSTRVLEDDDLEYFETLTATLETSTATTQVIRGATPTASVLIKDNNDALVGATISVIRHGNEDGSVAIIYLLTLDKVNNTGGLITFTTSFPNRPPGGSDTANPLSSKSEVDYDDTTKVVTIADGKLTATFTVGVYDDVRAELTETVTLAITEQHPQIYMTPTGSATEMIIANIIDSGNRVGQFKLGTNVWGLSYTTESPASASAPQSRFISGYDRSSQTGAMTIDHYYGLFYYKQGDTVTFSVAGLTLGSTLGKRIITPVDLEENGSSTSTKTVNITRFLMLLDNDADVENGIDISGDTLSAIETPTRTLPADFFSLSEASFTQALAPITQALNALSPTETHTLTITATATVSLENTLNCIYNGIFSGTFTGTSDYGQIAVYSRYDHPGELSAYMYNQFTNAGAYPVADGKMSYIQQPAFRANDSQGVSLVGTFTSVDEIKGEWNASGVTGTFTTTRAAGDWYATYRMSGHFEGTGSNITGMIGLDILDDGTVAGTFIRFTTPTWTLIQADNINSSYDDQNNFYVNFNDRLSLALSTLNVGYTFTHTVSIEDGGNSIGDIFVNGCRLN